MIPNHVFGALLKTDLRAAGLQVALTVIDQTLGYRVPGGYREDVNIPLTYFASVTGLSRRGIQKAIKQAELAGVIIAKREGTRGTSYALNTDTGAWKTRGKSDSSTREPQFPSTREPQFPKTREPQFPSAGSYFEAAEIKKEREGALPLGTLS